jgi:hypothetical protein
MITLDRINLTQVSFDMRSESCVSYCPFKPLEGTPSTNRRHTGKDIEKHLQITRFEGNLDQDRLRRILGGRPICDSDLLIWILFFDDLRSSSPTKVDHTQDIKIRQRFRLGVNNLHRTLFLGTHGQRHIGDWIFFLSGH